MGCVPIEVLVILIGPTRRWNDKILKPMAEITSVDVEELKIPKDIEVYEPLSPIPPPPPPSTDEVTIVPMKKADPSVSTNLIPTDRAIMDGTSDSNGNSSSSNRGGSAYEDSNNSRNDFNSISGAQMDIGDNLMTTKVPMKAQIGNGNRDFAPPSRHEGKGGTRPRGCPCCDPDNIDNIIDNMMYGSGAFL